MKARVICQDRLLGRYLSFTSYVEYLDEQAPVDSSAWNCVHFAWTKAGLGAEYYYPLQPFRLAVSGDL